MSGHAELSPSGAKRWMACPGSVVLEAGRPDSSSEFADEGTAAHHLAAECLLHQSMPGEYLGCQIVVPPAGAAFWKTDGKPIPAGSRVFEVDQDMTVHVGAYVENVREYALVGDLMVEQRMSIAHLTGEAGAEGTSDAVILDTDGAELQVHDLKYGRGVRVDAKDNEQLMIYALAALEQFGMLAEFDNVRLVIHQPRLEHLSEWQLPVAELLEFGQTVRRASHGVTAAKACPDQAAFERTYLFAGEDQCRFCKAKATCPALRASVEAAVGSDFESLTTFNQPMTVASLAKQDTREPEQLSLAMRAADLIEGWIKAVRAEVERRLLAGAPVPGFKLVQGKRGNRAWSNAEAAETALKSMRVKHDQMYDYSLISPTSAEKLAKAEVIGKKQWPKLVALITQADGKPSVAPESDKRPALVITPAADDFEVITDGAQAAEDLV